VNLKVGISVLKEHTTSIFKAEIRRVLGEGQGQRIGYVSGDEEEIWRQNQIGGLCQGR
jgi:hypothetical protein